jgi:hypothetical protein
MSKRRKIIAIKALVGLAGLIGVAGCSPEQVNLSRAHTGETVLTSLGTDDRDPVAEQHWYLFVPPPPKIGIVREVAPSAAPGIARVLDRVA